MKVKSGTSTDFLHLLDYSHLPIYISTDIKLLTSIKHLPDSHWLIT
jgi:hypothetical protein